MKLARQRVLDTYEYSNRIVGHLRRSECDLELCCRDPRPAQVKLSDFTHGPHMNINRSTPTPWVASLRGIGERMRNSYRKIETLLISAS